MVAGAEDKKVVKTSLKYLWLPAQAVQMGQ